MEQYNIYKNDGSGNLMFFTVSSASSPINAIKKALCLHITLDRHKGHWVAIPITSLTAEHKYTI